jgi:hypothetical protein
MLKVRQRKINKVLLRIGKDIFIRDIFVKIKKIPTICTL